MSTITQQIRALQGMDSAALAERYKVLYGGQPRVRNRAFLQRQIAWRIQAIEFGGLSKRATARLDQLIEKIELPLIESGLRTLGTPKSKNSAQRSESKTPLVGTTLTKRWHDQDIHVKVHANGFEWDGTLYRSLSAVAKAITGTTWNGRLFFGLITRKKAQ